MPIRHDAGVDRPAALSVDIRDATTGEPVSARVHLSDGYGQSWTPTGAPAYANPPEEHFTCAGGFSRTLPPGLYSLRIERGPEYTAVDHVLDLEEQAEFRLEVRLARWIDMNALGWYSGDLHNHRSVRDTAAALLAEDLNYSTAITNWQFADCLLTKSDSDEPPEVWVDAQHVLSTADQEIERLWEGPGAVCFLGTGAPIVADVSRLFPPNDELCRAARAAGAHVTADKPMWRDVPALAVFGLLDSLGVVHNMFNPRGVALTGTQAWEADCFGMQPPDHPSVHHGDGMVNWGLDIYYRLLNCGIRLPASGGSASGVLPSPVGFNRTYVDCGPSFTLPSWWDALRSGRSLATNGPMLFLTVGGRKPGAIMQNDAGATMRVEVRARSRRPIRRLELVIDGEVVADTVRSVGVTEWVLEFEYKPVRSGWIAARCFEEAPVAQRFAHTSPVYVRVPRSSEIKPDDARYFAGWMERERAFYERLAAFASSEQRAAMTAMFGRARARFLRLARTGEA